MSKYNSLATTALDLAVLAVNMNKPEWAKVAVELTDIVFDADDSDSSDCDLCEQAVDAANEVGVYSTRTTLVDVEADGELIAEGELPKSN